MFLSHFIHRPGKLPNGCVPTTLSMLTGKSDLAIWKELGSRRGGTPSYVTREWLHDYCGPDATLQVEMAQSHQWEVESLSYKYPLLVTTEFAKRGARDRKRETCHMILVADGIVYDSAMREPHQWEDWVEMMEDLEIIQMVVVLTERPGFGKNS